MPPPPPLSSYIFPPFLLCIFSRRLWFLVVVTPHTNTAIQALSPHVVPSPSGRAVERTLSFDAFPSSREAQMSPNFTHSALPLDLSYSSTPHRQSHLPTNDGDAVAKVEQNNVEVRVVDEPGVEAGPVRRGVSRRFSQGLGEWEGGGEEGTHTSIPAAFLSPFCVDFGSSSALSQW